MPFLLVSLVPAGVMPARAADGTLTLILCTADGPVEQVVDLATGAPLEKAPAKSRTCDWACGQWAQLAAASPPAPAHVLLSFTRLDPPPERMVLTAAIATGLPPATGPPAAV